MVIHPERTASVTPHVSLHVTVTLWGGASGGNELERKIDQRNRWMRGLFLAWPRFRDPQQAPWVCPTRPREREQTKPHVLINHPHVAWFYRTCGTSATCISSLWGMECPLTLKLSDTERRGWSKVDMWQMNHEPLVFSHQEHYGWDLERRNAKNKMWSNSPDGWSV